MSVVTAAFAETAQLRATGRVRTLAVTAEDRLPTAPDIPTLTELGIPWSLGALLLRATPSDVPLAVRDTLVSALEVATADPPYRELLERAGCNLVDLTGDEACRFVEGQDVTNRALLQQAGLAF